MRCSPPRNRTRTLLKSFFERLDLKESRLLMQEGEPPLPPWSSWSRTSIDMAQWAEDALLSVFLDLKGRAPPPTQKSILPSMTTLNPSMIKPMAELKRVDIGGDRHINTLSLRSIAEPSSPVEGDKDKKVIVMAHGYGAGLGFFYKNYSALAKTPGLHLYSIDWLGMANSSRPAFPSSKNLTNDQDIVRHAEGFFIEALEEWRRVHSIDRMILAGHSLGGYLCTGYALKYPQHVEKLILVSPAGVPTPPPEGGIQRKGALVSIFKQLWTWNVTPMSVLRAAGPFGSSLLRSYTSRRFAHLEQVEAKAFHDYIYHISAQPGSGEYALNSLLLPGAFARWPLAERVHDLKMPTTFVYGTQDWMDFRGALSVVDKMSVPTRVALVDQAGHHLYLDNPTGFNASLIAELYSDRRKASMSDGVLYVHDKE